MKLSRATTVQLVGRGSLKLSPGDHLATGGEGTIYRSGNTVVKLYLDEQKMAREGIVDKIKSLAKLTHPYLVAPRGVVTDASGKPVGWYMDYAPGEPLARAFTNDWRAQHKFGDKETGIVAARMQEVVTYAHTQQAVMADANELNWTVLPQGKTGPEPYALDVDSWAIGCWPARAIMPSIRDWQTGGITAASDWFAWGVVSFQLYTGLHPYKGTLAGYKPGELERRMRDNASVFAPGIRLNRAVRDFGCIPAPLLAWYEATFKDGTRTTPPSPLASGATPIASAKVRMARISVSAQGALRYDRLYDGGSDPAKRIFSCGVVQLESGKFYDLGLGRVIGAAPAADCEVIRVDDGWLVVHLDGEQVRGQLISSALSVQPVTSVLTARQIMAADGRIFTVTGRGLTELKLMQLGSYMLVGGQNWGALASTDWFDGVGVQDAMGAMFVIAPFGDNACAQVRVPELDGRRVITAKAGNRFVSVMTLDRQGVYRKIQLSFDRTYQHYTARDGSADGSELNLAILPRGVGATIVTDGELVIFVPSSGDVRRVADRDAVTTLKLANWDDRVVGIRDGNVWALTLK